MKKLLALLLVLSMLVTVLASCDIAIDGEWISSTLLGELVTKAPEEDETKGSIKETSDMLGSTETEKGTLADTEGGYRIGSRGRYIYRVRNRDRDRNRSR